jgi:beta-N-acetylhexosaminidase
MNAIARHQSVPDAAVDAVAAGVDLLLVCRTLDLAWEVYLRIWKAVRDGELDDAEIRDSLRRIARMKAVLPAAPRFARLSGHARLAREIEVLGR